MRSCCYATLAGLGPVDPRAGLLARLPVGYPEIGMTCLFRVIFRIELKEKELVA